MSNPIKIAVDAMGGENSPAKVIKGIEIHNYNSKNIFYNIFGDVNLIKPIINKTKISENNFELIHTDNNIKDDDIILDIGPKTSNKIRGIIENSETVLWNGPAGYFENPNFANGSYNIAKAITKKNKNNSIYSVVGGGDTIALINKIQLIENFNFVSTAGGAFLEYLEGKELPGIKALN